MSERRTEYLPLSSLRPNPRNPKKHADELIDASIDRFGFVEPIVRDDRTGMLVSGHGRAERLLKAHQAGQEPPDGVMAGEGGKGGEWLVPVVTGWASADDAEADAALVALNSVGERGGWEPAPLVEILDSLRAMDGGDGLAGVGYEPADIDALMDSLNRGTPKPDPPVPSPPAEPVTQPGDLWRLGEHRLLCGDATYRSDYDRVLEGEHLVGTVVTDPPYGVGIGAKNRALDVIDRADRVLTDLAGDDLEIEEVEVLWRAAFGALANVMPGGTPYYIFGPQGGDLGLLLLLLRDAGLAPRHILIWVKNHASFSIGRLDYDYQHEPIVYGWRPGGAHSWFAASPQTSVFHVERSHASPDHPTVKPVELLSRFILNSTQRGAMVLDPFAGSGTVLVAAQETGRRALMMEIDPRYCDLILRRWEELGGEEPVLESAQASALA